MLFFVYFILFRKEVKPLNDEFVINDRIKKVRNSFDLTQESFANRLNISRSTIGALENYNNNPSNQLISNVCNEFGINQKWIKTGKGPMKKSLEEIIRKYANYFPKEEAREALLNILAELENDAGDLNDKQDRSDFTEILNLLKKKYQKADRDTRGWITVELKRTFLENDEK
ncbi:helix-turn-helix domain-containing protein [Iocasia frigidifontis]|uniref:Helix-turn-helix domain-containing protein n=1 Tax=Iocasia fonsfrigidae TaxID=2682810 RepID=A0A8A7K7P3_9FIRM|nr:helix-turn-helix domain-containing protein [Iocasia fonsfrigidae]